MLTYSLMGADSGFFEVDDSTGQISTGFATLVRPRSSRLMLMMTTSMS